MQKVFNHYVTIHGFDVENQLLTNYVASLTRKDVKYKKTCKYCYYTTSSMRDYHQHMFKNHNQIGGGGLSTDEGEKLIASPVIRDSNAKNSLLFQTFMYKSSDKPESYYLDKPVNPYDMQCFDVLYDDLKTKLSDLRDKMTSKETILLSGSFGVYYKRPTEEGTDEIGLIQIYAIESYDFSKNSFDPIETITNSINRSSYSKIGKVSQGGSRWLYHRLGFLTVNAITLNDGVKLNEFVVGGKKRENKGAQKNFKTKKQKLDYYRSSEFLDLEIIVSGDDLSDSELSFPEDKECEADIAMIDDEPVHEEYIPMNFVEIQNEKDKENDINDEEILISEPLELNNKLDKKIFECLLRTG